MRKINDSRLYLYIACTLAGIALVLAIIAYYSMLKIEPEIKANLLNKDRIDESYKKAYMRLRKPHVFSRYENFDAAARPIKAILRDFDRRINSGEQFTSEDRIYLEILFERRMLGSRLTRNTFVFFTLLSLISWALFFYERREKQL